MSIADSASANGLLSTPLVFPAPLAGALAALILVMVVMLMRRSDSAIVPRLLVPVSVIAVCILVTTAILDRLEMSERTAEQRALLQRDAQLSVSATTSGSLACLDGVSGEQVENACEQAVFVDAQSTAKAVAYVSARLSLANYRTMVASARQRAAVLGERPAVPRISDLGHLYASSLGKLELDMMGSHQMSERQVLDAVLADAIATVFKEYVDKHGLAEIAEIFSRGVKIEVGDMLPSSHYAGLIKRVPPVWDKAFEVNASDNEAVRASCVEFVLAGLYATDQISRSQQRGRIVYET